MRTTLWPLLALAAVACTSAPRPRPDADAALAQLRPTAVDDRPPIESELMDLARDPARAESGLHEVGLLHTGADALAAWTHLLRSARESVDVQTFIWAPDEAGEFLILECLDAARRGVRVRILVDQMGLSDSNLVGVCTAHANLELRLYNPVSSTNRVTTGTMLAEASRNFAKLNQRMHNKVLVVDGRVAIVGGRNVEECYFDMDPEFGYLDRDALVVGPVVRDVERSFESYWTWEHSLPAQWMDDVADELVAAAAAGEYERYERRDLPRYDWVDTQGSLTTRAEVLPHTTFHTVSEISFHADPPGKLLPDGTPANLGRSGTEDGLLREAERYVVAQSNYLVFTEQAIRALRDAKLANPDLVLLYMTNSLAATANTLVYGVSRKQRYRILRNGLSIYEMKPLPEDVRHFCPRYDELVAEELARERDADPDNDEPYADVLVTDIEGGPQFAIHAKAIVVDGRTVLVGSHNYDPRSDLLNTESAVLIRDEGVAQEMERELRLLGDRGNAWVSATKPRVPVATDINEVFLGLSRALPIFDIWPVRSYGNYQLKEGAEPALASDPAFRENYDYAGEFPQVDSSGKIWKTRFFSWFGGLIKNLL